ncbi:tRNA threonylcarbamoyl adenosine modification protein YeaZ [Sphingomonas naasensis]|uniref:tRNA (Adenosine(37)-N6)-threonylcarbamoyltransferase complex dimerization subunit type 1 TsaB n=1 Tax=Sphingomonas naasensis TaxID=1344951 RepID=A0A4S1W9E4_9SPHN|nr:tRNA (adenosine(37)-N6)-threonylcarbamoyltransferase complex dimerization subunit type 1 TsaB [Sphingomonas naasensis]NIJ19987.1 tRNA threonylcarbamoyl adenosine modification protein YeaZ [Sphingomonas naasensis]TGX37937.1 tRNA (adenosine(37)-N6)-threonylcarbamoyltransferase complex dimerization subunit type 1 TsaB [Sphingomonas naasensis]
MLTLVIETATAACSVALLHGDEVVARAHEVVGRGHAERLLPMIAALPDQGRAPRILVDVGPGSFTGVRVGLAAALGLAIGWQAEVAGYSSLALLAATGFAAAPGSDALAVVLEGGHGEVFMQSFTALPLAPEAPLQSLVPGAALAALGGRAMIGNGVRHLAALDPTLSFTETLPRAEDARLLPAGLARLPARPIYGRAPDARTLAERGLA